MSRREVPNALLVMSERDREALAPVLCEYAAALLKAEGLRAFENPRSAALAHEVGHAIVGAHDGLKITSITVWRHKTLDRAWLGITNERRRWSITPTTPIREALTRACFIIAGEAGEVVLDPDGYRKGSSIDEVALSQRIVLGYARILGDEPERLWNAVRSRAAHIIGHNKHLAQELIARLDRTQTLRNRAMHDVLSQVQQIPSDWPHTGWPDPAAAFAPEDAAA